MGKPHNKFDQIEFEFNNTEEGDPTNPNKMNVNTDYQKRKRKVSDGLKMLSGTLQNIQQTRVSDSREQNKSSVGS